MLRSIIKTIIQYTYRPWVLHKTSRDCYYTYDGLRLLVKKGVFHPGYFFSTRLLLRELKKHNLENMNVLEPGAGSGLISAVAASRGARVTATDINPVAVEGLRINLAPFGKRVTILLSDLFDTIPPQAFDLIVVNPPYYARNPQTDAEKAWFCGSEFQYFHKFFSQVGRYMQPQTRVWLSMSEDCDLNSIGRIAGAYRWQLRELTRTTILAETTYIYLLESTERTAR